MTRRHFDANPIVDLLRGARPSIRRRFDALGGIGVEVSVIVVGELRIGVEKSGNAAEGQRLDRLLTGFAKVEVTEAVAFEYARLRARLERIGQKMDANDLWIAATALVHGATLVTADEAFLRVPGLTVENWRV